MKADQNEFNWSGKLEELLITGGAGFIGSTLANYYSKDNQVVVIDDLSMGQTENLNASENITFIEGSVTDQQLMEKYCESISSITFFT